MPASRSPWARNLAGGNLLCHVPDVEHPSSNVTRRNHVYVVVLNRCIDMTTDLVDTDGMHET